MDPVATKDTMSPPKPVAPLKPAEQAAPAKAADQMNQAGHAMADNISQAAQQGAQVAQQGAQAAQEGAQAFKANVNHAANVGNQAIKDTMDKSLSALNEVNAQSKRNLEALMASMTAATRGVEALGGQAMSYAKRSAEGNVEQAKALSAARSMQEVVELQTNFAKTAMEAYVAELNRASETITAAVKDSFRPLNERATSIVETVQSAR